MQLTKLMETLSIYAEMCIFVLGVSGNALTFIVYSRKHFRRTGVFSVYFRALVVSDTVVLYDCLYRFLVYTLGVDLDLMSAFTCYTRLYSRYSFCPISGYILLVVSLDRFVSIAWPTRFALRSDRRIQATIVALIVLLNMLVYVELLVNTSFTVGSLRHHNNRHNHSDSPHHGTFKKFYNFYNQIHKRLRKHEKNDEKYQFECFFSVPNTN